MLECFCCFSLFFLVMFFWLAFVLLLVFVGDLEWSRCCSCFVLLFVCVCFLCISLCLFLSVLMTITVFPACFAFQFLVLDFCFSFVWLLFQDVPLFVCVCFFFFFSACCLVLFRVTILDFLSLCIFFFWGGGDFFLYFHVWLPIKKPPRKFGNSEKMRHADKKTDILTRAVSTSVLTNSVFGCF